jgi:hypothetical protein
MQRRCSAAAGTPSSGCRRRKRYCVCCSAWVATKVPLPWRRTSRFSVASSSIALRTVPWLTLKRAGQLGLAGDRLAGLPLAGLQAAQQQRP